jgi:hypothetical protein
MVVEEKDIYYTNGDKATLLIALTAYDIQAKNYAKNTSERKQKRDSSRVLLYAARHDALARSR